MTQTVCSRLCGLLKLRTFDARLGGSIVFVPPISPGSLDVGKSRLLVGVIPLLRGFRTTRSTSTVVAPTSLDRRKPRQPLQLVALRACSEPCRSNFGSRVSTLIGTINAPASRAMDSVVPGRPCSSRRSVSREMPARAASSERSDAGSGRYGACGGVRVQAPSARTSQKQGPREKGIWGVSATAPVRSSTTTEPPTQWA